jgi:hypothetical protein
VSEALRSIFAEFGFDVDIATLDRLDKRVRETIKSEDKLAKANDVAAKKARESLTAEQRLAKIRERAAEQREDHAAQAAWLASEEGKAHTAWQRETAEIKAFSDIAERVTQGTMVRMGDRLRGLSPRVEALAKRFNLSSEAVGKIFTGATMAAIGAMALGTRAAIQFADAFAQQAEEIRDASREARVSTSQMQELRHAAVIGGVGVERMNSAVTTFGQSLRKAERWGNGTTFMLRRLGIQARDSNGRIRPTGELMDELAVAFEHIESPARRARVATQLFGEAGRRMLDIMHTGPGGIRALREELAELGGGVTPEAVEASRRYTQATERMSRAQDSLRSTLAVALLPALSWLVERGAHVEGLFARLTHGTHVVQIALAGLAAAAVAMAAPVIAAWAPIALPFVVVAAKVALLVAVLDDLMTFVEGGDSAMGRLIDSFAGAGTAVELAKELRDDWEAVVNAIERAIEAVARFTGIGASAASGSSRGPMIGGQRVTPRSPVPTVPDGAFRMRIGPQTVPATRTVAAPGSVSSRTRVTQINRTSAPVFHINGADPRATAAEAVRLMQQAERDRRDGDHPLDDDDGDDSPTHGVE